MNRNSHPTDNDCESDAVWKLLEQAPAPAASARFAENTVRAAKLAGFDRPWWARLFSPAPRAGLAAATAAVALGIFALDAPSHDPAPQASVMDSPEAVAIQNIAETEALFAAVDQLDDFSDQELVSLIGL